MVSGFHFHASGMEFDIKRHRLTLTSEPIRHDRYRRRALGLIHSSRRMHQESLPMFYHATRWKGDLYNEYVRPSYDQMVKKIVWPLWQIEMPLCLSHVKHFSLKCLSMTSGWLFPCAVNGFWMIDLTLYQDELRMSITSDIRLYKFTIGAVEAAISSVLASSMRSYWNGNTLIEILLGLVITSMGPIRSLVRSRPNTVTGISSKLALPGGIRMFTSMWSKRSARYSLRVFANGSINCRWKWRRNLCLTQKVVNGLLR